MTGVYSASIPSPTRIPADPALTSHGSHQAEELGRHLLTLDPPIDAVYSSPYYRCLQTIAPYVEKRRQAEQMAAASGGPATPEGTLIRPEPGIGEYFGAAPFKHPKPATADVLKPMFPAYDDAYLPARTPSDQGETMTQLYSRVAATVRAIIDRSDAEGHRAVVLCSHAAVVIALGRVLTASVPQDPSHEDFKAFTCGLGVYRREGVAILAETADTNGTETGYEVGRGDWTCELNSDCSFLSSGAERGW